MYYNTKITYYNNEIQISKYDYKIYKTDERMKVKNVDNKTNNVFTEQCSKSRKKSCEVTDKNNQVRSLRRSKQSIYEIARANDWNYFCTFTFADNRYCYDSCKDRLRKFLNNFKTRCCAIEYLVVPEQHKDGAWHFHALINGNLDGYLCDTWRSGRFELKGYRLGKCEVEPVKDTHRVSSYITKYITKDLQVELKNKRRYFCSKGVKRGESVHMLIDKDIPTLDFILGNFPEFEITHTKTTEYNHNRIDYIQLCKPCDSQ